MNLSFLRDKTFMATMLSLAIPVAFQQFITAGFNMIDVVMVGQLGEASIAALGLANQVFFLLVLFLSKMATKVAGVYPATKFFRYAQKEGMYTTLLMSTGLTFGSISALFGLTHGIIDKGQYSLLIAAVIGSAVVPTIIANAFYIPKYLLPRPVLSGKPAPAAGVGAKAEG